MIRNWFIRIFKKYVLPEHQFKPSMIVKRDGSKTLYEVEACYYDKDLNKVLILRLYGKDQLISVSGADILDWVEHKGLAPDTVLFDHPLHNRHK